MKLLPEDYTHPAILRLKVIYEERLADYRVKNDNRLNADETARLRGRIFEVRNLLALVSDRPPPQETDDA